MLSKTLTRLLLIIICLSIYLTVFSQNDEKRINSDAALIDSLNRAGQILNADHKKPQISLSKDQALKFLQQRTLAQYWKNTRDPFRQALNHLIVEASHPRFDSSEYFLNHYQYDSLNIPWDKFYIWEPMNVKIPVISKHELTAQVDSVSLSDTIMKPIIDSALINRIIADNTPEKNQLPQLKDTTVLVVIDTLNEVTSDVSEFPFRYMNYPYQGDSIEVAVKSLLNYLEERDSTIINFTGLGNTIIPVWMNSKEDAVIRYWLKNELSDSVTIWISNPEKNTIGLYLEQGVNFRRPVKQGNYSEAKINVKEIDKSKLHEIQKIYVKTQLWKYRSEASLVFSQSALSNWVRGGENSVSSLVDITGYADYTNNPLKLSSSNFVRLKLGFLKSGANPLRKNLDLFETNSKLNHKAFGKFDFSAILLFKTQIAHGKNYSTTPPELVSKFFNPAIVTVGIGLDYKPSKNTSINFSPLSYKGTFVPDTVNIDQTKFGIPKYKRSLNEPGVSLMVSNQFKPYKSVIITNRLQLFTNYINNPQNIDVDWEMIVTASLNWFTDVRFNTHLIFDDDTKTVNPDSNAASKTARIQFKEMVGLSLVFRF